MNKWIGFISVAAFSLTVTVVAGRYPAVSPNTEKHYEADYNGGNLDGMIQRADASLSRDKDNIAALLAAATAYAMKGSVGFSEHSNGAKAIQYADKAILIDPSNSEAYRIKGYSYEIQEIYESAHQMYDQAIKLNPANYQALSNKGHAYDLQGDTQKAEQFYKRSLEVYSQGEHALLNISRLYIRESRFQDAKKSLKALVTTTANVRFKAEGYQILAEIYRTEMDYTRAEKAIALSTGLDGNVPQAWVTRGRVRLVSLLDNPDAEDAIQDDVKKYAQKALTLHPHQASAYTLLFDMYGVFGKTQEREAAKEGALRALEQDITLGQNERKALRSYLLSDVTVQNIATEVGPEEVLPPEEHPTLD
jgi:tetratricopeptide (TPR) repeat protein